MPDFLLGRGYVPAKPSNQVYPMKSLMKSLSLIVTWMHRILFLTVMSLGILPAASAQVTTSGAWSLPLPTSSVNGAAYLTIHNQGADGDRLLGADSDIAEKVELHNHVMQDGLMSMMRLDVVDIPPNSAVEFAPGGLHIMLMGLTRPLLQGQQYTLILQLEQAGEVPVEVMIDANSN